MKLRLLLSLVVLLSAVACSGPRLENQWGAHGSIAVFDEYDLDVSTTGQASTDYNAVQGGIFIRQETRDGVPVMTSDFALGYSEYDDLQATDLIGGVRYYLMPSMYVRPFAGLYSSVTYFDEGSGPDMGSQISLSPTIGAEFPLSEQFFLDLMIDYAIPVVAAESSNNPSIDREASGLAVRVGFGVDF